MNSLVPFAGDGDLLGDLEPLRRGDRELTLFGEREPRGEAELALLGDRELL
jgi:hypothetical protein